MQIKAKLIEKYETKTFGSGFKKREFVVEYAENPNYPEYVKFELVQDKCEELDKYSLGQEVDISFNIKGRKWTNPKGEEVYFNSLQAWRLSGERINQDTQEPEWLNSNDQDGTDGPPF